jgi:hypothetical protein
MERLTDRGSVFTQLGLKEDKFHSNIIDTIKKAEEKVSKIQNDFDEIYNLSFNFKKNQVLKNPIALQMQRKSSKKLITFAKNKKKTSNNVTAISFNNFKAKSKSSFKTTILNSNENKGITGNILNQNLVTNIKKKVSFMENMTNKFHINMAEKVGMTNLNSTLNSVSSKSVVSKIRKNDTNTDLVSLNSCFFTSINNKDNNKDHNKSRPNFNLKLNLNSNSNLIKIQKNETEYGSSIDSDIKSPKFVSGNIYSILKNKNRNRNFNNDINKNINTLTKSTEMKTHSESTNSLKTMKIPPILNRELEKLQGLKKEQPYYDYENYSQKLKFKPVYFSGKINNSLSLSKENSTTTVNKLVLENFQKNISHQSHNISNEISKINYRPRIKNNSIRLKLFKKSLEIILDGFSKTQNEFESSMKFSTNNHHNRTDNELTDLEEDKLVLGGLSSLKGKLRSGYYTYTSENGNTSEMQYKSFEKHNVINDFEKINTITEKSSFESKDYFKIHFGLKKINNEALKEQRRIIESSQRRKVLFNLMSRMNKIKPGHKNK